MTQSYPIKWLTTARTFSIICVIVFQTKRFKLAHQKSDSSLKSDEVEELEIGDSSSLPSSQEEFESKIKREVSLKDTDQEDSEYESAEEKWVLAQESCRLHNSGYSFETVTFEPG